MYMTQQPDPVFVQAAAPQQASFYPTAFYPQAASQVSQVGTVAHNTALPYMFYDDTSDSYGGYGAYGGYGETNYNPVYRMQ